MHIFISIYSGFVLVIICNYPGKPHVAVATWPSTTHLSDNELQNHRALTLKASLVDNETAILGTDNYSLSADLLSVPVSSPESDPVGDMSISLSALQIHFRLITYSVA